MGINLEKESVYPAYTAVIYIAIVLFVTKVYGIKLLLEIGFSTILLIMIGILIKDIICLRELIHSLRSNTYRLELTENTIEYRIQKLKSNQNEYSKLIPNKNMGTFFERKIEIIEECIDFNKNCLESLNRDASNLSDRVNELNVELKLARGFIIWERIATIILSIHLITTILD